MEKNLIIYEITNDELQRYGIITIKENQPYFLHRTFAEYFAAISIAKDMTKAETTILYEIFVNPFKYENVIKMMEILFENNSKYFDDEKLHKCIAKFIDTNVFARNHRFFLHEHFYCHNNLMIKFLLLCMKHSSISARKRYLWDGDESNYLNIFMLATRCDIKENIEIIWLIAQNSFEHFRMKAHYFNPEEDSCLKEYFFKPDEDSLNAFQTAFLFNFNKTNGEDNTLDILYKIAQNTIGCIDKLKTLFIKSKVENLMIKKNIVMPSSESFQESMKLKWTITKDFLPEKADCEIIKEENWFSACVLIVIKSNVNDYGNIEELFLWAKSELSLISFETFRSKFFLKATEHIEDDSIKDFLRDVAFDQ